MPPADDTIFLCDTNLDFVRTELHDFLAYWNDKRGLRQFPGRADIKPGELTPLLPWMHMHDVGESGAEYRIRLVGTILSNIFGKGDMRGQPLSILPPVVFDRVKQGIERVLEARAPIRTYAPHAALPGQDFQGIESCFAPLSHNGTDIDIIIAVSILDKRK
ncbi:MAG: PAS domain-containing protein [Pseudomonadota bacterium]